MRNNQINILSQLTSNYHLHAPYGALEWEHGIPVTAKFIPIPNIASANSKFLLALVAAAEKDKSFAAFDNEVVKALIEFKWTSHVSKQFMRTLVANVFMIVCFTVDVAIVQPRVGQSDPEAFVFMIFAIGFWAYFTLHEILQFLGARKQYLLRKESRLMEIEPYPILVKIKNELKFVFKHVFVDLWNALDFFSLSGIFFTYVMRLFSYSHDRSLEEVVRIISSLALVLCYLNMLYYLQGFSTAGEPVRMIVGITLGVRFYLVVMLIVLVGFCFGFYVLFQGADEEFGQSSPIQSLFKGYTIMLGTFETNDFSNSVSYSSTAVLFVFFTLFINIIMLNLLITYMGDIFDEIQKSAKAEFMYGRACIINEYESLMRVRKNEEKKKEKFPKWLQVLVPTGEGDEERLFEEDNNKKFEHLEMKMDKFVEMVKREFEEQRSLILTEQAASRKGYQGELSQLKDELERLRSKDISGGGGGSGSGGRAE